MLKRTIIPALIAIFAMVACTKEFENPGFGRVGSTEVHSLSVGIEAGSYLPADETKATMEAIVRVNWQAGDSVSVVNATTGKLLGGCLKATEDGEVVTFTGDVIGQITAGDKLYYIYPRIAENADEVDFAEYEISLKKQQYDANKSGEVCFYGYAEDAAAYNSISKRIKFNLVTAYVHLNMSNLPAAGQSLTSVDLSNVNGGFKWVLNDAAVSAEPCFENQGISVTCTNTKISNSGNAVVRFAVPASPATEEARKILVNKVYLNSNYKKDARTAAAYYNQLYTTWQSNVTVEEKPDKVEVTIDNAGSTEAAEGILPVEKAFKYGKTEGTSIEVGGIGNITFDATASAKILKNAESASATKIFFKVEDVTVSKPVQDANLVYEVTMKTVDENGVEVFNEDVAEGVATVTVPLGDNVESVQRVSLVDESGNLIEGGVVDDSVVFDETSRLLTFKVVHFSKYAIQYTEKGGPTNYVAQIGETKYETLVAAVDAAGEGNTILMIADFATTEKVVIAADKDITLDLNGKKISYTTDGYGAFIENKGQLKVKDSGTNGIITAEFSAPNWSDGCYTINNAGTYEQASRLVIESGTIENTSPAGLAWPVSNGIWGTKAELIINGGTIHSVNYVPVREYLQYGGTKTIVINGGKLISDNSRAIAIQLNDATVAETGSFVVINGGEFSCNGSGILYVDLHAANLNTTGFTMTVNGGKFKNANTAAPVLVYDNEGNSQTSAVLLSNVLKGGIYSAKPADGIVMNGYRVTDNADEVYKWTIVESAEPLFTVIFTNGAASKTFDDVFSALAAAKEFEASGANGQAIITHSQEYDGYPNAFLGDSYIPIKQYTGEVEKREYKFGPVLSTRSYDNFNLFDDSFGFYAFNPKKTLNHIDGSKISELEAVMALVNNENVGTDLSNLSGLMQMMIESGMLSSDEKNFMEVYNLVRSFAFDEYGSIQQIPLSLAAVFNADIPRGSVILSGHYANGYEESFMGYGWVNMEMGEGSGTSVPEYNQWMYGIYPYSGQAEDNTLPAGKPVNMPMNTSPYNCSVYSQYNHFYDWHPVFADYLDNMFVLDCAVTNLSEGNTGKKMTALVSVPLSEKIIYVLGSKEYTLKSPNEDRVFIATNNYDIYTNTVN